MSRADKVRMVLDLDSIYQHVDNEEERAAIDNLRADIITSELAQLEVESWYYWTMTGEVC